LHADNFSSAFRILPKPWQPAASLVQK